MSQYRPRFETVVFPDAADIVSLLSDSPEVREVLFVDGVPRGFLGRRYQATEALTVLIHEARGPLICFGSSGLGDSICLHPETGEVVEVINAPRAPVLFVNSSLEQFTTTVKNVIDRFPYYGAGATDDELQAAADELSEIIREIDPAALTPDRYWSTFIDDVRLGDLSTEAVLAISE